MRHEDAGLALWVAGDQASRERTIPCDELAMAIHAAQAAGVPSWRQRVGSAVIAFGERLAGETRPRQTSPGASTPHRRFAGQGS